jgi:hypothetical protein
MRFVRRLPPTPFHHHHHHPPHRHPAVCGTTQAVLGYVATIVRNVTAIPQVGKGDPFATFGGPLSPNEHRRATVMSTFSSLSHLLWLVVMSFLQVCAAHVCDCVSVRLDTCACVLFPRVHLSVRA